MDRPREQRNPTVGKDRRDENDRQHRAVSAEKRNGTGDDGARKSGKLDQLAEDRTEQEDGEVELHEAGHPLHEEAGENRCHSRRIGQQNGAHRRDRREQDDAVAAISRDHQEDERCDGDEKAQAV